MAFTKEQRKAYDAARRASFTPEQREKERIRKSSRDRSSDKGRARSGRTALQTALFPLIGKNRRFVSIDSEGCDYGPDLAITIGDKKKTYRKHKSFLWHATTIHPTQQDEYLENPEGLSCDDILEWLTSLPKQFPYSLFVAFAFSYDVCQLLKGLPYNKLWEIQNEAPFECKGDDTIERPERFSCRYKKWKISYIRGKMVSLSVVGDKKSAITIYDVFSYFQQSFVKACGGMNVPDEDIQIIKEGKQNRIAFDPYTEIEFVKKYTNAECRTLCHIMTLVRKGVHDLDLFPAKWYGPGAISSCAMRKHNVHDHYWPMVKDETDMPDYQRWAHHAFFGGRIELAAIGVSEHMFGSDINSAYPSVCARLPSMKGGEWKYHEKVTREQVASFSMLSLVHVKTYAEPGTTQPRFYPFPYRKADKTVLFPGTVNGYYMQEEVLAGLEFERRKIAPRSNNYRIELLDAWEFVVKCEVLPFAFVKEFYYERKRIPKTDIRNQVIKLIINSMYGKTAQAVGNKVPKDANVWYAAAITAGTRAQALRAMMDRAKTWTMTATDGLLGETPFSVEENKELGGWESGLADDAVLVMSGIYTFDKGDKVETKTRGVNPNYLRSTKEDWIRETIVEAWKEKKKTIPYTYVSFYTLGMSLASEASMEAFGCFVTGQREVNICHPGRKRRAPKMNARPWERLEYTEPAYIDMFDPHADAELSAMHRPEWIDDTDVGDEKEQHAIFAALWGA